MFFFHFRFFFSFFSHFNNPFSCRVYKKHFKRVKVNISWHLWSVITSDIPAAVARSARGRKFLFRIIFYFCGFSYTCIYVNIVKKCRKMLLWCATWSKSASRLVRRNVIFTDTDVISGSFTWLWRFDWCGIFSRTLVGYRYMNYGQVVRGDVLVVWTCSV